MGRLVLLALTVLVLVWLVRRALRERQGGAPPRAPGVPGELVACAHCGVHLPRAEARSAAGGEYCSEEHARLGPRQP
ncbi:MAG TPA: PP0621 family protein [Burkholderiales bacterium]|nr:PP0621 family protein [Burkholderiales bacterium]